MNLLKFGEKNTLKINSLGNEVKTENMKLVNNESMKVSMKQVKLYEEIMEYIDSTVDEDIKIKNIPTANRITLKNYTIEFDTSGKYIHVKDRVSNFVYGVFSLGNKKLVSGDEVQFLIFNVLQRITCPNATADCLKFCYANKSNCSVTVRNSNSVVSRERNIVFSMLENFEEITTEVINFVNNFTNRKVYFRFHEAGDIYSREYWEKIKNIMFKNPNTNFMFYTKTVFVLDEINELNSYENISIRYSLDNSTNKAIAKKCFDLNCLVFIVIDKNETIESVAQIGINNTCNVLAFNVEEALKNIAELKEQLEEETRKTYKKKIQSSINELNASIVNRNKKCTKCLKCMNKNNVALFVATH